MKSFIFIRVDSVYLFGLFFIARWTKYHQKIDRK